MKSMSPVWRCFPFPPYNVISQQPANAACTCSAVYNAVVRLTNKTHTCPVRSGCQASVQILIIEIAGNWKTDAATAPERLSSAAGDAALQARTADRHKPAGMAHGRGRARRRVEGRFHGVSKGTPNVERDMWGPLPLWHAASVCVCCAGYRVIFAP